METTINSSATTSTRGVSCSVVAPCDMPKRKAEVLCPSDIFKRFGDAAVTMRTVPKFRVFWQNFNNFTDQINPGSHYNAGIAPVSHSGFFVNKGMFIVSSIPFTTLILLAAMFFTYMSSACWVPGESLAESVSKCCSSCSIPSANNLVNAYSELPGFVEVMRGICAGQSFADFFEFYAEVFNVNGCGENFIYRAYLVGLDFDTGVGIYRIDDCDPWNKCLPLIRKQKFLLFANSKCYTPGNTVHTIADLRCTGSRSYSSGVVVDNANVSRQGDVTYECIATNMTVGLGAEGAPILNDCGYVVGVVTAMTGCSHAVGVSSSFISRVIDAILTTACHVDEQGSSCDPCNEHGLYIDLFGCIVYRHGTINWCFRGKTALDLNQLFLQKALGAAPSCAAPSCPDPTQFKSVHPFAKPTECDPCCGWEGLESRFYNDNTCRINRELLGIIIDSEPCGQLAEVVEECQRSSPNWGKGCNEYYQIEKGDVVTHLNGAPLGTLPNQNTPDNLLYSMSACDCVELRFQKANEMYTSCHSLRLRLEDSICWIGEFKPIVTKCMTIFDVAPLPMPLAGPNCVVESLMQFVFWWLHTMPQVYRASFFSNLSTYMLTLNNCMNKLVYWATLTPENDPIKTVDNTTEVQQLALALQLTTTSRDIMTCVAKPSVESCYVPCAFIDFISSFQHPTSFDCFSQTIPNYLQMNQLVTAKYGSGATYGSGIYGASAILECRAAAAASVTPDCFAAAVGAVFIPSIV